MRIRAGKIALLAAGFGIALSIVAGCRMPGLATGGSGAFQKRTGAAWEAHGVTECSDFVGQDGLVHRWYRGTDNTRFHNQLGHATSTDGVRFDKSKDNPQILPNLSSSNDVAHPYVFSHPNGRTYLAVIAGKDRPGKMENQLGRGMYLYDITGNPKEPVALNGGKPVLVEGGNQADWYFNIYNVGIAVDGGGRIHALIEGQSGASPQFRVGYAYTDLDELDFNRHIGRSVLFDKAGNCALYHIPERNALLVVRGDNFGFDDWQVVAGHASLSDDPAQASSWRTSRSFRLTGPTHVADPSLLALNGKLILSVGLSQTEFSTLYLPGETLLSFYDKIASDTRVDWIPDAGNPTFTRN
jgi:hypothetical protein